MAIIKAKDLNAILIGEPVEAMEAAKRLVDQHDVSHAETLVTIANNKALPLWSRIAAIWTLGLIDDDEISVAALKAISQDDSEPFEIKDHALEAINSLTDDWLSDDYDNRL